MSYLFIAVLMIIPAIYSISLFSRHTKRYDHIITNVSRANRLNQIVKFDISNEIWEIVACKKTFEEGRQYQILTLIKSGISTMMESTESEKNIQLLEVANRAVNTLEKYVDMLGEQMAQNAPVSENEVILEEIRGVASLLYDILQDFIVSEIETCAIANESIKRTSLTFTRIQLLILLVILGVSVFTSIKV
ncbi:MAG: two-component sensor histidine kinase, partial [Spirochaetaceae bacterium]|nr:two-component sensor histidine kinase [Spirochaetaceae bacterium]